MRVNYMYACVRGCRRSYCARTRMYPLCVSVPLVRMDPALSSLHRIEEKRTNAQRSGHQTSDAQRDHARLHRRAAKLCPRTEWSEEPRNQAHDTSERAQAVQIVHPYSFAFQPLCQPFNRALQRYSGKALGSPAASPNQRGEPTLAMNYDSKPYVYSPIYSYSQKGLVEGVSRGGLVGCGEVGLVEGLVTIDR